MNTTQLEYFLAVYECGSYVKASEQTYASRQTLGRAVSELEREFGQKLFAKQGRGITPTAFGTAAADIAKSVLSGVEHLHTLAKETASMQDGPVPMTLAVMKPTSRGAVFNGAAFEESLRSVCDIPFTFQYLPCEACYAALDQNVADVAIVLGHRDDAAYLYEFLKRDKTFLAVSKDNPIASKETLSLADLTQLPLAQPVSLEFIYARITNLCEAQGLSIDWKYVEQSAAAERAFIAQGGGVFVAANATLGHNANIALVRLADENLLGLPFYFIYDKTHLTAQAHTVLTKTLAFLTNEEARN